MAKLLLVLSLLAGLCVGGAASGRQASGGTLPVAEPAAGLSHPALREELLSMRGKDQDALRGKSVPSQQLLEIQHANTARLKAIVAQHGWPTLGMVGNDAAQGAWLVVQHADDDPAWQREALALMEALVLANEVRKSDVAYLRDRLDVADHRPQLYGTQGRCVAQGDWQPFMVADPDQLEARRQAMDMISMSAYLSRARNFLCQNFTPVPQRQQN